MHLSAPRTHPCRTRHPPEALQFTPTATQAATAAGQAFGQFVQAPGVLKLHLGTAPCELSQLLQQLPAQLALQLQAAQLLAQLPANLCEEAEGLEGLPAQACAAGTEQAAALAAPRDEASTLRTRQADRGSSSKERARVSQWEGTVVQRPE